MYINILFEICLLFFPILCTVGRKIIHIFFYSVWLLKDGLSEFYNPYIVLYKLNWLRLLIINVYILNQYIVASICFWDISVWKSTAGGEWSWRYVSKAYRHNDIMTILF